MASNPAKKSCESTWQISNQMKLNHARNFSEPQMESLVNSIREHGILQPIIVRPTSKGYKIIAGERRWRASKQLGIRELPAIVKSADSLKTIELALVENIQREDLNPIEKATAFSELKRQFQPNTRTNCKKRLDRTGLP